MFWNVERAESNASILPRNTAVLAIGDERVDFGEVANIVQAAADARNGWKTILARWPIHLK